MTETPQARYAEVVSFDPNGPDQLIWDSNREYGVDFRDDQSALVEGHFRGMRLFEIHHEDGQNPVVRVFFRCVSKEIRLPANACPNVFNLSEFPGMSLVMRNRGGVVSVEVQSDTDYSDKLELFTVMNIEKEVANTALHSARMDVVDNTAHVISLLT